MSMLIVSSNIFNLLLSFIVNAPQPMHRIGATLGISEIRQHPWFARVEWNILLQNSAACALQHLPSVTYIDPTSVNAIDCFSHHHAAPPDDDRADSSGRIRRAVEQHALDDAVPVNASDQALFAR